MNIALACMINAGHIATDIALALSSAEDSSCRLRFPSFFVSVSEISEKRTPSGV